MGSLEKVSWERKMVGTQSCSMPTSPQSVTRDRTTSEVTTDNEGDGRQVGISKEHVTDLLTNLNEVKSVGPDALHPGYCKN